MQISSLKSGKLVFLSFMKNSQSLGNANWKTLKIVKAQLTSLCMCSTVCGMSILSLNCSKCLEFIDNIASSLCDMVDLMPLLGIIAHSRFLNYSSMAASVML